MNEQKLERELSLSRTMVLMLSTGVVMFLGATLLLLLDIFQATGNGAPRSADAIFWMVFIGTIMFMFGALCPSLNSAWNWWRGRQNTGEVTG